MRKKSMELQNKNNMKFNSQICTTRKQSERLLALGLKKETADMCYKVTTHDFKGNEINEKDRHYTLCCWYDESSLVCGLERKETIPAWSLHRLIEMMPESIHLDSFANTHYDRTLLPSKIIYMKYDHTWIWQSDKQNDFDKCVDTIEWLIKEGYFNKEYLV